MTSAPVSLRARVHGGRRPARCLSLLALAGLLAACATPDGGAPASDRPSASPSASEARPASRETPAAADPRDLPTETVKPTGKADWVAVYESPPEARYADQRVIFVDRASVQPNKLENVTYFVARTREVSRSATRGKIQELAVICEGTPMAPATALRGEGTEDASGGIAMKRAPGVLNSLSQFSTQRVRIDANNPNTFIVRAICMLGLEGNR